MIDDVSRPSADLRAGGFLIFGFPKGRFFKGCCGNQKSAPLVQHVGKVFGGNEHQERCGRMKRRC